MTVPEQLEEEPADLWRENTWGVPRNAEPPKRSPVAYLVWIVLTIVIILSLVLPYILPYFTPRRIPVRDGLQASQRFADSSTEVL